MSRLLSFCVLSLLAGPACADDKSNTLTAKEIADGWILLFDGETNYGWSALESKDKKKPELTAKDGVLMIAGTGGEIRFNTSFRDFEVRGEYRTQNISNRLALEIRHPPGTVVTGASATLIPSLDDWKTFLIRLTPQETTLQVDVAKQTGIKAPGLDHVRLANLVFKLTDGENGRIELRNLKLRPLEMTSLFNGKDLDGWSVNKSDPKRIASKWTVTPQGELSLKNGPGDLVSDKQFDNFVLQVECKTLGTALNSGVFFRNIPGQYQNGYEAQIQNSYKEGDRTKPSDFGTGAIYRRIPARKVVSDDNAWFTMTVAADGRHIATWVNGYQTVDWTDERPADDNPRKGFRAEKGPLSLQGHDPSTDLLFRNFRIAPLPNGSK